MEEKILQHDELGEEKRNDIEKMRQHNISKEMLKIGITPHLAELSRNGDGFKVTGPITMKQKKHIEKFAAGQYEVWRTLNEIVKQESGNWTKFVRDHNLPRDFKKTVENYLRKAPKIFNPFGLNQSIKDK